MFRKQLAKEFAKQVLASLTVLALFALFGWLSIQQEGWFWKIVTFLLWSYGVVNFYSYLFPLTKAFWTAMRSVIAKNLDAQLDKLVKDGFKVKHLGYGNYAIYGKPDKKEPAALTSIQLPAVTPQEAFRKEFEGVVTAPDLVEDDDTKTTIH